MRDEVFSVELTRLPEPQPFDPRYRRAPNRGYELDRHDTLVALKNALRYVPRQHHEVVAPEFLDELRTMGRIYGYRYRPAGRIWGRPVDEYVGRTTATRAMQVMIDNNLDFDVALYPYELVTYGESGQVCQNWMQYRLIKKYLEVMNENQTLVVSSGHPVGLFPSRPDAPRAIITNGLMVGAFDTPEEFHKLAALGCVNYGQMTAGGWMYIGPQGIVHGTYITLARRRPPIPRRTGGRRPPRQDLHHLGARRHVRRSAQGARDLRRRGHHRRGRPVADRDPAQPGLGFRGHGRPRRSGPADARRGPRRQGPVDRVQGNIVDLLEYLDANDIAVDLISDQTSCHVPYDGGYTPAGVSFDEGREILATDRDRFKELVDASLRRHFRVLRRLTDKGARFWDYGNAFMKAVFDAGEPAITSNGIDTSRGFIWPSYVEDIMGPLCFDFGYGPFRWVCLSGKPEDLHKTDQAAMSCIDPTRRGQDRDNWQWIHDAEKNALVVGTQARILYSDAEGRTHIAKTFNAMVREGEIGPVMMGRDHHDTGGTDSPFRETANIYDGSQNTADMAHQCWAGNAARGMTMAVLSNGGGVGTGKAINGGFGLVLDGSEIVDRILDTALEWDAMSGVSRRAWARNENAITTAEIWNKANPTRGHVTIPRVADEEWLGGLVDRDE